VARVVVIGAGVGGLAAAARLAAQGHRVELHERAATHGGKLGEFRRDGFTFDTGPSLLTLPQVFLDLFATTGGPAAELEFEPVDPSCGYRFADGTRLDMPHDPAAVPAALDAALGPGRGAAWQALYDRSARLWNLVGDPVLHRPLRARDLARFSTRLRDLRVIAPWRTLRGLGETMLPDPRMRAWLDRYATYSGSDPRRTPSVLSVTAYVEQRFGAWWVRGGLRRLGDALVDRCRELGVAVYLQSEVTEITTAGRGVSGVRLADGRSVPADVVVSDADATVLYGDLLRRPAALRTRARTAVARAALGRASASVSGFVLLLALDGAAAGAPAHRIWFPPDYDAEFDALFRRPAPVADPTVYVHAPGDPAMAPAGCESWFVLVNAPGHDPSTGSSRAPAMDWDAPGLREQYADRVLEVLAHRGEDVRNRIRWREVRSPADLQRATGSPGGAIYGTASHGARAALLRPANRSPVPGLYLVGGSAHPGGGLPIVALSAAIVADLVGPA
jgi:phytoene desaturase